MRVKKRIKRVFNMILEFYNEKLGVVGRWMKGIIVSLFVSYIVQALLFIRVSKGIAQKLNLKYLNDDIVACFIFLIIFVLLMTMVVLLRRYYIGIYYYFYYSLWKKRPLFSSELTRGKVATNTQESSQEDSSSQRKISIEDSYLAQDVTANKKVIRPLIVRKDHLFDKWFWPKWAFEIVLLNRKPKVAKDKGVCTLKVDLTDSQYGIYNNKGKTYLETKFIQNEKDKENYEAKSMEIFEYIRNLNKNLPEPEFPEPIRWASGGVMPIVEMDKKYWVALLFRDINPKGLNVANGASESKTEYLDPRLIISREFSEEFMVIDGERTTVYNEIKQKLFKHENMTNKHDRFYNKEFANVHIEKRLEQDGITVVNDKTEDEDDDNKENDQDIIVKGIATDFRVEVMSPKTKTSYSDIIFTVNPSEFGIEIISLIKFALDSKDYILDGEIVERYDTLVRRPIIMISLKYLHDVYKKNNKSLGSVSKDRHHMDCKTLESVPAGEYKIFYQDIDLRRKYMAKIDKELNKEKIKNKSGLEKEYKFHQDWFESYGSMFDEIRLNNPDLNSIKHKPLITLCPVTWKTLELAFHHNYLRDYIK